MISPAATMRAVPTPFFLALSERVGAFSRGTGSRGSTIDRVASKVMSRRRIGPAGSARVQVGSGKSRSRGIELRTGLRGYNPVGTGELGFILGLATGKEKW